MHPSSNPGFRTKARRVKRRKKTVAPAMTVNPKVMALTRFPAGDAMMIDERKNVLQHQVYRKDEERAH